LPSEDLPGEGSRHEARQGRDSRREDFPGGGYELPPLVAVAHGSRDPRAAATVGGLLAVARARAVARGLPGLNVRTAFLDHSAPSLPAVLSSLAPDHRECVVVPLLLTPAYHSKTDIPGQTAKVRSVYPGLDVEVSDPLGPHRLLLGALDRRVREAWPGPRRETSVVLVAAGSSDPSANATNAALAATMAETGGWRRVTVAYASAASPSAAEAVAALVSESRAADGAAGRGPVVVASYLLAPGYFADKVRDTSLAAGATAVTDVLGAAPEVADIIIDRYLSEAGGRAAAPLAAWALCPLRNG
jgi:sirohydrochlorin ferrochelatase